MFAYIMNRQIVRFKLTQGRANTIGEARLNRLSENLIDPQMPY